MEEDAMTMMQYHTAAEALEAATSELAKAKASIAELKAKGSALMDELGDAQRNAAQAEAAWDAFHADIAGLRIAYDDLRAELAEVNKAVGQYRDDESQARAVLANWDKAEREWKAELATVRVALETYGDHLSICDAAHGSEEDCDCGYDAAISALATPPRRTPDATEGEGGSKSLGRDA
jgi:chromosome segregation ATPase